ncbi:MAG: proteasome assembly chaperone family protein [Promethearchaeota archaeon]
MNEKTELIKCCKFTHGIDPDAVMVIGAANAGLVGTIAAAHIIEELKLIEVAHINSPMFPPISVFIDGVLKFPFRIYADAEDKPAKIFLATSELPLNREIYHDIAHKLMDFAEDVGIKNIVTIVGFPVQVIDNHDVFFAAEPEIVERLKKIDGLQPLPKGMIYGIEALVLNETLERSLDGFSLIVPVIEVMPATRSAAAAIEALNKIFDFLEIKTQALIERDEFLQKKLKELAEHIQRQRETESGGYVAPPPSKSMNSLFT